MKKILLLILTTLVCSLSGRANINMIVISSDGETTRIALKEKPVVTVNNGALVITAENSTITYDTEKIITFNFIDAAGIEDLIFSENESPSFFFDGNILKVYNLRPNLIVSLYDLSGILCYQEYADSEGHIEIDLDQFADIKSVIIMKLADKSIKISNRR